MELDIEQKSETWFAVRRCYITGTMFAAIMGKNPYHSLQDVLEDMERDEMGLPPKEMSPQSQRNIEWGVNHESDGVTEYEVKVLGNFPKTPHVSEMPVLSDEVRKDNEDEDQSGRLNLDEDQSGRLNFKRVRHVGFVIDRDTFKFGVSPDGFVGDDGIIEVNRPFHISKKCTQIAYTS